MQLNPATGELTKVTEYAMSREFCGKF